MSERREKNKFNIIEGVLLIVPLFSGLLSLFSLFLVAILCSCGILYQLKKNKRFVLPPKKYFALLGVYWISFLVTSFYAIDKGMTVLAFFKNAVIVLFFLLFMQYEKQERYFQMIAYSGAGSVIVSIAMALLKVPGVWNDNRMQGVFLYANSYGLYLLLGLTILMNQVDIHKKDYFLLSLLMIGIVLTNSRAIILLTIFSMIVSLFFNKQKWKKMIVCMLAFLTLFVGSHYYSKLDKRIDGKMLQSSEFLTRLMYYQDAILLIKERPFGYGYEGFYYKQSETQTGVYDSKFVHNSVLQVLLDVGFIPCICLMVMVCFSFFDKKQTKKNRLLMILIMGHSLIDIDLEYLIFVLMMILMIPEEEKTSFTQITSVKWIFYTTTLLYTWLLLGEIGYKTKDYEFTYQVVPFHTEALQERLYSVAEEEEQFKLAKKIYRLNQNVSGVYEAFSNHEQKEKNFDKALVYEKKRLALNKYTMYNYIMYADFLSKAFHYYRGEKNLEKMKEYGSEVLQIESRIQEVLNETNPLCYRTIHPPQLEMPQELREFIQKMRQGLETLS